MTVLLLIRRLVFFLFSIDVFLLWTFKTGRTSLSRKLIFYFYHRGIRKYDPIWIYLSGQVSCSCEILATTAHENVTTSCKEDVSTTHASLACVCCGSNFVFGLNFSNRLKFFKLVSNFLCLYQNSPKGEHTRANFYLGSVSETSTISKIIC